MEVDINEEDYYLRRIFQFIRKMEMYPTPRRAAENYFLKKKTPPPYDYIILCHNI